MSVQVAPGIRPVKTRRQHIRARSISGTAVWSFLLVSMSVPAMAQAIGADRAANGAPALEQNDSQGADQNGLVRSGAPQTSPNSGSDFVQPKAPTGEAAAGSTQLQEVVVTVNKRSETLLKAPNAVSVVSMAGLRTAGVVNVGDLNSTIPNTEIRTVGADNGLIFSIRGISETDFNDAANPAIATYIDGVYVGRTEGLAGALYDLDRIEVLRGPQGTLYGRNSTGGNVNIITANPSHEFGGSADLSYGNYNDVQMNGVLNVPVTDSFLVRGAITLHRNDGYTTTFGNTANNYGKSDDFAGRLTFLWTPISKFTWRFSVDDYVSNGTPGLDVVTGANGKPATGSPYSQPVPFPPQLLPSSIVAEPTIGSLQEPALSENNLMLRSRMDYTLFEGVVASYIAGYQDVKDQPQTILVDSPFFRNTPSKSVDQELDLSVDRGPIHNISGLNYYHQTYYDRSDADFLNSGADTVFLSHGDAITEAWGAFDQVTVDLTRRLKVTGGVRYSHEIFTDADSYQTLCPISEYPPQTYLVRTLLPQQFSLPGCQTYAALSGNQTNGGVRSSHVDHRAGLEYDFTDRTTGYFTTTTGFKAGGVNIGSTVDAADFAYRPEKTTNYEFGLKTRLFNNRVGLNSALFYTDFDDIQVTQLSRSGFSDVTTNAAGAHTYGVELEGQWRISSNDRLSGFVNYLMARYTDYRGAVDQQTGNVFPSLIGYHLPFSPEFSGRIEYSHEAELPNGDRLIGTAAVYLQTDSYLREFNLPIDKVPSYTKTDLTVQYVFPKNNLTVTGFVHNLEDDAVRNGSYAFLGSYLSSYNPPRTFGARIAFKY